MTYRSLIAALHAAEGATFIRLWSPWYHRFYPNYWRYQRMLKRHHSILLDQHGEATVITSVTEIF